MRHSTARPLRICTFDLETWDLSPEFGPILCASVLTDEGQMVSFRQDTYLRRRTNGAEDMIDDRQLIADLTALLQTHHVLVGWHIKGFDIPLLRTRARLHGLPDPCPKGHFLVYDPMWGYKGWRGLKPKSASLASVASFYGLEEQKYGVESQTWMRARAGNREAMDIAVERCESDVRVTAEIAARCSDERLLASLQRYP